MWRQFEVTIPRNNPWASHWPVRDAAAAAAAPAEWIGARCVVDWFAFIHMTHGLHESGPVQNFTSCKDKNL